MFFTGVVLIILFLVWWGKHALSFVNREPERYRIELPKTELSATVVFPKTGWHQWDQIPQTNQFATNGPKGLGYSTISSDLTFSYSPVLKKFPARITVQISMLVITMA